MAAKQPTRTEVNDLVRRVRGLPDLAKFELYTVLRDDLAGSLDPGSPEVRLIRERHEALEYMRKAIKELDLAPREVPTRAQYDELAKRHEWPFDGARVSRLWERWRNATQAHLGTRRIETPAARGRRKHKRGSRSSTADKYLEALKTWLAADPELETRDAYNQFAEAYNQALPEGALPLVRASTIDRCLPIRWTRAIEVARGRQSFGKAIEADLAERLPVIDDQTLVGEPLITLILKLPTHGVSELIRDDPRFPVPVAHLGRHAAWLYADIKRYRRGHLNPPRTRDELQYAILGVPELALLIDRSEKTVRQAIRKQAWDRAPQPEGVVATGVPYWRREIAEAWVEQRDQRNTALKSKKQANKERDAQRVQDERKAKQAAVSRQQQARQTRRGRSKRPSK